MRTLFIWRNIMLEIGVQSACWYSENDPDGSLQFIKECGFGAVDFNIDTKLPGADIKAHIDNGFFSQSVEELCAFYRPLKEAIERQGVRISQMHAPFPVFQKDAPEYNEFLISVVEKTLAVAQYLGCPAVVVHPITRSTKEKERATNFALYRALIPAGKKYGVKICLENLFTTRKDRVIEGACSRAEDACYYIDTLNAEAGEEIFGFCLDIGHANLLGRNIRSYINTLGKRLTILHIHDNNGATDSHMMPYTQTYNWGKDLYLNWEDVIEGLRDIDYRGVIAFETFRVLERFPKPVYPEALKLIAAIGAYFRERILTPKEEN